MPNAVTYSDDNTLPKAYEAIAGDNDLTMQQTFGVVKRLLAAGILLREEAGKKDKSPGEYVNPY